MFSEAVMLGLVLKKPRIQFADFIGIKQLPSRRSRESDSGGTIRRYFCCDYHPKPKRPTGAMPGSLEKVEVLRERVERGEYLWHADDRKDYLDQRFTTLFD